MDPSDYGILISKTLLDGFTRYVTSLNKKIFQIDISLDGLINNVAILGPSDLKWVDTSTGEGFKREIGKSTIYFVNGKVVLRKQQLNHKVFSKIKPDSKLVNNFVTMDIETITQNGNLTPYLICAYNGSEYITSYGKNQKELFTTFINSLLTFFEGRKRVLNVYAHNLSGFDGIFLMKHLLTYGKVEPLLFNGKLMSIKVKVNIEGCHGKTIVFKDSYLLLPLSLRKLCKAFEVPLPKGYFPFKLTNIFYTGILPKFIHWSGISLDIYESLVKEYKHKMWSFQHEAVKYCKLDCLTLHQILIKFNELIFNEFNINIHTVVTLPALAMKIYKTHYMPKDSICQLLGKVEKNIRKSYTGGAVDVYIPHNRIGSFFVLAKSVFKKLYYYDVNSLYPFVMANHPMPIGKPVYFQGDIRSIDPEAFGFFYCNITSPEYLEHPILQRRIKTSSSERTIAGLGTWTGWISSMEMDNAIKYGYQFEILNGYQFDKGNLFKEYVNKMYKLRLEYPKGHAMNLVAKLLMNSLYGKFGMRLEVTRVDIFDISDEVMYNQVKALMKAYGETIHDFVKIDDHLILVRDSLVPLHFDEEEDMYHGLDVNIAIASAITSSARVHMSYFKNNPLFKLFYSDTDSVVIDNPLSPELVGNKLGQVKLEYNIERAVFLAPKVYGFITDEGSEIIKVKGITPEATSNIHIGDLDNLLIKDSSKEINQEKWFKLVIDGEISVTDVAYTLKVTSNKRSPIYINNFLTKTKPFNYDQLIKICLIIPLIL